MGASALNGVGFEFGENLTRTLGVAGLRQHTREPYAGHWSISGERESAHVFALMNMVSFDALVASHDAKYTYWLLRPSQADPGITVPIFLPNFPSYPSNHGAISGGMAAVLGHLFPAERSRLDALADEAALSRVLGGIHYRFDGDAGLALGRSIAASAAANDLRGPRPILLR